jgi:hypothetical protein
MVEFSKTPIDKAQLLRSACENSLEKETNFTILMIDHDIVGLDISVHNAFAMTEVQCLHTISTYLPYPDLAIPTFKSSKI